MIYLLIYNDKSKNCLCCDEYDDSSRSFKYNNQANKLGEVVIGLLTDKAIASYKRVPIMEYEDRYKVVSSIKNVSKVIKQNTHDYTENQKNLNLILLSA